jgi:hypothetical protein
VLDAPDLSGTGGKFVSTPTSYLSVRQRLKLAVDGDPRGFYPDGQAISDLLHLIDVAELVGSHSIDGEWPVTWFNALALAVAPLTAKPSS